MPDSEVLGTDQLTSLALHLMEPGKLSFQQKDRASLPRVIAWE